MRPLAYRLRIIAVLLGLAQGGAPALAVAHELVAAEFAAPVAHMESQGASHDVAAHAHDCGICRHNESRSGLPPAASTDLANCPGLRSGGWDARAGLVQCDDESASLPRGPPVG